MYRDRIKQLRQQLLGKTPNAPWLKTAHHKLVLPSTYSLFKQ
jgi:hypothetical protein